MSAKSKRHMGKVAATGCILCLHQGHADTPGEVHHIKEGVGAGQRQSDWLTVCLCPEHHRGASGLHGLGTKGFYTRYKLDELDLLAMQMEAME